MAEMPKNTRSRRIGKSDGYLRSFLWICAWCVAWICQSTPSANPQPSMSTHFFPFERSESIMKKIRETCSLRLEVLKGELTDAIFAAEFGKILEGNAPQVYQSAETFFRNTHPAIPLKKVVSTIFHRLANPNEAGAIIRLSTGFGGGKTHTLIALWHLAQNIQQSTLGVELLPAAGHPKSVSVVGADGKLPGTQVYRDYGNIKTHSLWADMAYQFGGKAGYDKMSQVDDAELVPDAGLIRQVLPDEPVLIMLDEMPVYMATLSDKGRGALLGFLDKLMSEIVARRQAVLVITDTARQFTYQEESSELARRIDGIVGRKASDFDPIGGESAQVIIRRLFESVDRIAAEEISAEYFNAYKRVSEEHPGLLPPEASRVDYAKKIADCYPFHPRLLDTAQNRLGALQDFQRSRGVLRLFARILRDIWEKESDTELITAGDLDWTSDRIQSDLLQRLNKDNFKPAVDADIAEHAGKLDDDYSNDIHRRVASALLLESLPLTPSSAMDKAELTLAVLRPSDVASEPGEAIDRLMRDCWHTYKNEQGKFQFRYEPNANKVVEERAENLLIEDARMAVRAFVQGYFGGHNFQLVAYPNNPSSVLNSTKLQLVLCESEELAQSICNYQDDSNPEAKSPRAFRNAIFAVSPTPAAFEAAAIARRKLMAAEDVLKEQRKVSTSTAPLDSRGKKKKTPLLRQVEEMLSALRKKATMQAIRAFDRVVFQGRRTISLEEKYLVDEEVLGGGKKGQSRLMELLKDEGLIYEIDDAIDVDLLMQLIKGATPSLDCEGAHPANAIHERALTSPRMRLLRDESPIRNSILEAVKAKKLVVRLPNNDVYDSEGCVTGTEGKRRRIGNKLTTLKLDADVLVAPSDAPCVAEWGKITPVNGVLTIAEVATRKEQEWGPGGDSTATAYTWEEAINHSTNRPLVKMTLKISDVSFANKLMACAQPFNANSVKLSVLAGGKLKDGGTMNFKVDNIRPNNPLKPIDTAKRMLRGTAEGAMFNAELVLEFGSDGTKDIGHKFDLARKHGLNDVKLTAQFGAVDE